MGGGYRVSFTRDRLNKHLTFEVWKGPYLGLTTVQWNTTDHSHS